MHKQRLIKILGISAVSIILAGIVAAGAINLYENSQTNVLYGVAPELYGPAPYVSEIDTSEETSTEFDDDGNIIVESDTQVQETEIQDESEVYADEGQEPILFYGVDTIVEPDTIPNYDEDPMFSTDYGVVPIIESYQN
jgi:hypothetical protein